MWSLLFLFFLYFLIPNRNISPLLRCAVTPPALVEILGVDLLTSAFGTLTFVRGVAALIGIIIILRPIVVGS